MRQRGYDLLWMAFVIPPFLAWATFGGEGWLLIALTMGIFLLRAFVFTLQMSNNSEKIITDKLVNSTDGRSFDRCDVIGPGAAKFSRKLSGGSVEVLSLPTCAFPAVKFFEPGTGEWGLAKKIGGNEHGFIIAREDCCFQLSEGGSVVIFAATWTLKPIHITLLQLFRRIRPTDEDPRGIIPREWWDKLTKHPRFNPRKSAIHLCLDPTIPVITVAELCDPNGEPLLALPGKDAIENKNPSIPPTIVRLRDIVGEDGVVLDVREKMRFQLSEDAKQARTWAGNEIKIRDNTIQALHQHIATLTKATAHVSPAEQTKERILTTVAGTEQSSERSSR